MSTGKFGSPTNNPLKNAALTSPKFLIAEKSSSWYFGPFLSRNSFMGQEINYSIMSEGEFKQRRDTFDKFIKDIFDYKHIVVSDNLKK
jgi:hypothetical protein